MKNLDAPVVKQAAFGQWDRILQSLAHEIPEAAFTRLGKHVACPVHAGGTKGDGFKLFKRDFLETGGGMCNTCGKFHDGFKLLMWLKGWDFPTTVGEVGAVLGMSNPEEQKAQRATNKGREEEIQRIRADRLAKELQDNTRIRLRLKEIWAKSIPMTDPAAEPARLYFASRKILIWDRAGLENVVRFHPSLPSYNEELKFEGNFPAIVSLICNEGKPVTIHRIYLTEKGEKAPVDSPKKMCNVPSDNLVTGGAIFTSPVAEVIDVSEGLETAFAVEAAMAIPVWPLVNATLMELFNPPAGVKAVRIWVDKDVSGRGVEAGKILQRRCWEMGLQAHIIQPTAVIPEGKKGVDWNDVLITFGRFGFPRPSTSNSKVA
jgi:putative DNA primase/helicase